MPQARKVALVSGGSRGLGAELVSGFLKREYGVATLSRTKTAFITNMLRARKGRHFHWSQVDGRDHEALRAFVQEVGERLGRIDVLVNNAGIAMEGVLPTMRTRDIVEAVEVNLTAALVLAQACSRLMLRQGSGCIVNVSSVHAIRGHAGVAVYSATKAALDGLTRSLARELGPVRSGSTPSLPAISTARWSAIWLRSRSSASLGARRWGGWHASMRSRTPFTS